MYTTSENDYHSELGAGWSVFSPEGDWLVTCVDEEQALALLSHLNR